jgi:very-short-patch-repair endonuclease
MRDAEASHLGYESLRFDDAMVLYEWPVVAAAILAALGRLRSRA